MASALGTKNGQTTYFDNIVTSPIANSICMQNAKKKIRIIKHFLPNHSLVNAFDSAGRQIKQEQKANVYCEDLQIV